MRLGAGPSTVRSPDRASCHVGTRSWGASSSLADGATRGQCKPVPPAAEQAARGSERRTLISTTEFGSAAELRHLVCHPGGSGRRGLHERRLVSSP